MLETGRGSQTGLYEEREVSRVEMGRLIRRSQSVSLTGPVPMTRTWTWWSGMLLVVCPCVGCLTEMDVVECLSSLTCAVDDKCIGLRIEVGDSGNNVQKQVFLSPAVDGMMIRFRVLMGKARGVSSKRAVRAGQTATLGMERKFLITSVITRGSRSVAVPAAGLADRGRRCRCLV